MITVSDINRIVCGDDASTADKRAQLVALEEHNGWSNRETWLANLWLTNEEPTYRACLEILKAHPGASDPWLGEVIAREVVEPMTPASGFMADLGNQCLARVDWAEVARSFREG
jgi:hypothetical protein